MVGTHYAVGDISCGNASMALASGVNLLLTASRSAMLTINGGLQLAAAVHPAVLRGVIVWALILFECEAPVHFLVVFGVTAHA